MKSMKLARIIALSFLLLAMQILPLTNSVISTAQSQTASPNLDGTQWKARFAWKPTETLSSTYFAEYEFGKESKVKFKYYIVSEISVIYVVPKTNPMLPPDDPRAYEGTETKKQSRTDVRNIGGEGTYKQKGTMIRLEFPDHTIDASIKVNTMEGIITMKGTGERSIWNAERISKTGLKKSASKIDNEQNPNPTYADAYQKRGDSRFRLKDYQGAISDYSKVIQLCSAAEVANGITDDGLFCYQNKRLNEIYLNRGIAKDRLGNKVGACEDFRKSCSLGNRVACDYSKRDCN